MRRCASEPLAGCEIQRHGAHGEASRAAVRPLDVARSLSCARAPSPRALLAIAALGGALGCGESPAAPRQMDGDWAVSTPAAEGLDTVLLASLDSAIRAGEYGEMRSLLIVRHGALVFERYYAAYGRDDLQPVYSVTKSVISALIGIAIARGEFPDLSATVHDQLPAYQWAVPWDTWRRAITLRHLLTMTSGLEWIEFEVPFGDPANSYTGMSGSADWVDFVLRLPMEVEPGGAWRYCTGCSVLLGSVLERSTGVHAEEYAARRLFDALGINAFSWERGPGGMNNGGSGLQLRARDMAKFGLLYLQGGVFEGRRVVPYDWVLQSFSQQVPLASDTLGYSFHWWIYRPHARTARGRSAGTAAVALGLGDKHIFVLPDLDMVVVSTASNYPGEQGQAFRFLNTHIVPATR